MMYRSSNARPSPSASPRGARGFTLIELMIAVAVAGILAAVAYPAYLDQMRKSRRSAAQSTMLAVAQKEMQVFLDSRSYAAAANAAAIAAAPLRIGVGPEVTNFYTLAVAVTTPAGAPPTFTITATPTGNQASDTCGTMTVNHLGVKTPASGCW
jgi:type IV pilus assembly protein PilE